MTTIMRPTTHRRHGATDRRPAARVHVGSIPTELGRRLGVSAKAAEHRLRIAQSVMNVLPEAARAANQEGYLRLFSAKFDICLQHGSAIPYSIGALRGMAAADSEEGLALIALLTDPDSEEKLERHIKALEKEIAEKTEVLVMEKVELARRRAARTGQQ